MSAETFIEKLTEMMDTEKNLTLETKLADVEEWDSLSFVTFLTYCNAKLKKSVTPEELKAAVTVGDLFKFVGESDVVEN